MRKPNIFQAKTKASVAHQSSVQQMKEVLTFWFVYYLIEWLFFKTPLHAKQNLYREPSFKQ